MAEPRRFRYWVPRITLLFGTVDLFAHWLLTGEDAPPWKPGFLELRVGRTDRLIETPIYEYGQSRLDEWMLEPIHPSAEGHRHIAEALAELVSDAMGELRR